MGECVQRFVFEVICQSKKAQSEIFTLCSVLVSGRKVSSGGPVGARAALAPEHARARDHVLHDGSEFRFHTSIVAALIL